MTASPTASAIGALLAGLDDARTDAGVLDEGAKREIRRAALTAVCVPGYQVPFGSREMPVARGWGSGGLQVTLALVGSADTVKVIDQGDDGGVNATNLRRLIAGSAGCEQTTDSRGATIIQTRHRAPEQVLGGDHILVLQVPVPEPLRGVQCSVTECARMHAESDYSTMWVSLYEDLVRNGVISRSTGYPVLVDGRYVMATTPMPRRCTCSRIPTGGFGPDRPRRSRPRPPTSARCRSIVQSGHYGWSASGRCTDRVAPRLSPAPAPSMAPRSARPPVR